MASRITVIGDGGWGTALALVLQRNGHAVTVWGPFVDQVETIRQQRENSTFLPGIPLPEDIQWTADRQAAADAELVVMAVPTRYYREVAESFAGLLPEDCGVVSVAKGLDARTHHRMTEVAAEVLRPSSLAALSGPSHAEEVARGIPTAVVAATQDPAFGMRVQDLFGTDRFRVYTTDDVVGVELGGALKNVVAIAVGASDGLGFGDNTRAALITRGLVEISRLGGALGAQESTFAGLSGMGDLIVTCTSRHSRNRGVGERLGKGETLDDIMGGMKQVAEGVWNCASARALARELHVDVPITEQVYAVLHEGKAPAESVADLMGRASRPE